MHVGSTCDVRVIVLGNEYGELGSNPVQDYSHFTECYYSWEGYESNYSLSNYV